MALFSEHADVSVRPAVPGDEVSITEIQLAAWRSGHADVLGSAALDSLDPAVFEARWAAAIRTPPGAGYRVLAACEGATVVGFASVRPLSADEATPLAAPGGELLALEVAERSQRTGHGSRLLAATVDLLRQDGATYLVAWVLDGDSARAQFLRSSGLGPDDTTRELATGPTPDRTVSEHRWSAEL
ncbi:GNAT family N-acetyltransferase [Pengzhenrongella frigida]|uniref:GNAT family N-acetyltransferase n=1 Tax=Pengzhenrongella frigida TaxID=1259133 RepID=A0A4Q5N2Q9_9MICO|nr:GNAT family N-acetyltransferase [Cellulomonas sp. HLT2-17]RYV52430.1 GNAT family N-acetyltransferase [Cellulomonas sp. HLT2-17]